MEEFKDKIKELRRDRNISQQQLANDLKVSKQAVSKWEKGYSLPDIASIEIIATYFGVTTDYLLNDGIEVRDNRKEGVSGNGEERDQRFARAKRELWILRSAVCVLIAAVIALSVCVGLAFRREVALPSKVEAYGIEVTYMKEESEVCYNYYDGYWLRLSFYIYNTTDERITVSTANFSVDRKNCTINYASFSLDGHDGMVFRLEIKPVYSGGVNGSYTVYYIGQLLAKYKV